jgi:regulator of sigma E protease
VIILLVVIIFGLLIFIHEFGHFIAARRGGIEVEEFGFGFPPRLVGIKRGNTIYSLNWIPLGGFVRMKGEDQDDSSPGSFEAASFKRKLLVMLAGVGMNLLVAYALFTYLAATSLPGSLRYDLNLPAGTESAKHLIVLAEGTDAAAKTADIRRGDSLLTIDGRPLTVETDLTDYTREHAGQTVTISGKHGDQPYTATVKLKDAEAGKASGYLGVTPLQVFDIHYGWRAPLVAAEAVAKTAWLTVQGFVGAITGLFIRHTVSDQVTGPVGIVVLLSNIVYVGFNYVLFFVASISLSLAVINVLPIPALDGGRLAFLVAQKLLGRRMSQRVEGYIHMAGFALLLLFMAVITYVDIKRF